VSLAARATDRRVDLVVEDTGPGPPEAVRAALMEPFVTGKPEGIGLGLAVAKAVAEAHGGTLSWSRADGRTRFAISLPEQTLAASAGGGHLPGNTRS
jgi:signal transduction histidine kinase